MVQNVRDEAKVPATYGKAFSRIQGHVLKRAGYRCVIHEEGAMTCQRRKEGFGTDSETENQIGGPTTEGSRDYDREGNRCVYGGAAAKGDGESKDRDGEEVG